MKNKTIIILAVIFVLTNVSPIRPFLEIFFSPTYYYTTGDGAFSDSEMIFKGRLFDGVERRFTNFKEVCKLPDAVLYRTFRREPQRFWLWGQYLFHPKYRLPYLEVPPGYHYDQLNTRCKN